jgi:type IV pilus assembly protein PilQ
MIPLTRLKSISAGMMIFCFLLTGTVFAQKSDSQSKAVYTISGITLDQTADGWQLVVQGKTPPAYTMYELFEPLRIVLDIAAARLLDHATLPSSLPRGPVQSVKYLTLTEQDLPIVRLEISLTDDPAYTIERKGDNIIVNFAKSMPLPSQMTQTSPAAKQQPGPSLLRSSRPASLLKDIEIDTTNPAETRVYIKTNGPITDFSKGHLVKSNGRPARLYIDVANLTLPGKMLQYTVGTSLAKIRVAQRKSAVRIVFDSALNELFPYEVEDRADGLLIKIAESSSADASSVATLTPRGESKNPPPPVVAPVSQETVTDATSFSTELIVPKFSSAQPKAKPASKTTPAAPVKPVKKSSGKVQPDSLGFAGYEKQKITVDFFKIDLHNVFRLFGEISGQNIVVDEGVSGTLTLALNDIPWDFALDIILNLKDLQKEERFNTIVISPKAKQFLWPKDAAASLAVTGGERLEALSVQQRLETPKGVVQAKALIEQATAAEKSGQFEKALSLYETAFGLWPQNAQLASRISSLCLTQLGLNDKAIHYAKATLTLEPANAGAALLAAIGSANMKKTEAAKTYFDLAISGPTPAGEALISYAAFAEEYQSYNGALALLARHGALFGDTLDTMVAKARILDKLGHSAQAVAAYNAVLLSGYAVPEDLERFIQQRIAAAN